MAEAGRRLMFFFDGTSNRVAGPHASIPTNVFRMIQALTYGFSGVPQIAFYISGVGTRGDVISSITGRGFDQIIMEAFINLSSNYMPGDKIYIFGFSRGAAAARALSGLISTPGLLWADHIYGFPDAWKYFLGNIDGMDRQIIINRLQKTLVQPPVKIEESSNLR